MNYYDAILAGIFASLTAGVSLGMLTPLSLNLSVAIGAVAAAGFMYHGMFQNAPVATQQQTL